MCHYILGEIVFLFLYLVRFARYDFTRHNQDVFMPHHTSTYQKALLLLLVAKQFPSIGYRIVMRKPSFTSNGNVFTVRANGCITYRPMIGDVQCGILNMCPRNCCWINGCIVLLVPSTIVV